MAKTTNTPDYVARANEYCRSVANGDTPAGDLVRRACQRHLDDMARTGWRYRFDTAKANRACLFLENLPHVKGHWAAKHQLWRLEPWQCWVVGSIFGWVDAETGLRRFRQAYVEVPRKNGKSMLAAGVGLYMLAADREMGAEVYCGATTEQQAWEVFRPARWMAERTPDMCAALGIGVNAKTLAVVGTGSYFRPVIGKPGDGASVHCGIVDEYHEHATDELASTMRTGMGSRQQPLLLYTTTAGIDTGGPCYALHCEVADVLRGTVSDDTLFGVIYHTDEGDDWTTEAALAKANPNWRVGKLPDVVLAEQAAAVRNARLQGEFLTKHLNVWHGSRSPYYSLEDWNKAADPSLRIADFVGCQCWGGMDLAAKRDVASVVWLFRRDIDGRAHYYLFARHYLPSAAAEDPAKQHYGGWVRDGHLTVSEGDVNDYEAIYEDVLAAAKTHGAQAVGYDPYDATQMAIRLTGQGVPLVEIAQNVRNLSAPMKELDALLAAGRLHHTGDPVLAWMVSNVTAKVDANDNVFPRKERPEHKIDGAVAAIMAMGRAMADVDTGGSVYETRGLIVF